MLLSQVSAIGTGLGRGPPPPSHFHVGETLRGPAGGDPLPPDAPMDSLYRDLFWFLDQNEDETLDILELEETLGDIGIDVPQDPGKVGRAPRAERRGGCAFVFFM